MKVAMEKYIDDTVYCKLDDFVPNVGSLYAWNVREQSTVHGTQFCSALITPNNATRNTHRKYITPTGFFLDHAVSQFSPTNPVPLPTPSRLNLAL
jgi:hypothetical protein